MAHLGVGVIIKMLGGSRETVETIQSMINKTITKLEIHDNALYIHFENEAIRIWDDGQSCCETRWMHTDDDLSVFVGSHFISAEVRDGPEKRSGWVDIESQFLLITTDLGTATIVNYNEHNGYYGGFWMAADRLVDTRETYTEAK
jgi:hypothetical protein